MRALGAYRGRQGYEGGTHLVSPATVAAAAIAGHFVNVREFLRRLAAFYLCRLSADGGDASPQLLLQAAKTPAAKVAFNNRPRL